jgi:hypothetical protein
MRMEITKLISRFSKHAKFICDFGKALRKNLGSDKSTLLKIETKSEEGIKSD